MDYTLQKRIIGAIILIVAAIVFVPMLLDGPGQAGTETVDLGIPEPGSDGMRTEIVPLDAPLPAPRVSDEFQVMPDPAGESSSGPSNTSLPGIATAEPVLPVPDIAPDASAPQLPTAVLPIIEGPGTPGSQYAADTSGRWHVTLGSYANAGNARRLVADMRRAGLPARSETVTLAGKPAQRVRIGPYADRVRAEAARLAAASRRNDVTPALVQDDSASGAEVFTTAPSAASTAPAGIAPADTAPIAAAPATPADSASQTAPVAPPPRDARGWVVQIGAFSRLEEANAQVTKLRTAGFAAFVDRLDAPSGTLHRVRVGPEAQRAGADRLQVSIWQSLAVEGVVMPHP